MNTTTAMKRHYGIFGSPPEPIFNIHPSALSAEFLVEWLQILASDNNKNMKKATHKSVSKPECYYLLISKSEVILMLVSSK